MNKNECKNVSLLKTDLLTDCMHCVYLCLRMLLKYINIIYSRHKRIHKIKIQMNNKN